MEDLQADLKTLESAMRLFFQTMKRPQRWTDLTVRAGVSIDRPGAMILQVLASSPTERYGVQDLATLLGIEAPSVTRKTQELESSGYIRRVRSAEDKRSVSLELTPAGLK